MRKKVLMSAAAILMTAIVSAGTVFADDNITGGESIQDGTSTGQVSDVLVNGEENNTTSGAENGSPNTPGSENGNSNTSDNSENPAGTGNDAENESSDSDPGGTGTGDTNTSSTDPGSIDAGGTNTGDAGSDNNGAEGTNIDNTEADVESGENTDQQSKPLSVALSGQYLTVILTGEYSSVSAAVWSEAGGQDDLVWYPLAKQDDGTYRTLVNLGLHGTAGKYNIHVYSGNEYISGESVVLEAFEAPEMVIATIANNDSSIVASVRNAAGFTNVRTAVWGAKDGQNDLRWYDLKASENGTYNAVIDLTKHGESGAFYLHAYGVADGKEKFLDGKAYYFKGASLPEPSLKTELDGQILKVLVENAGTYPTARAAVWSEADGQDDLVWYTLTKNSAGSFETDINLAAHNSTGRFIIHVYSDNSFIGGGTVMLDSLSKPVLTAEKAEDSESRFTFTVENAYGFSNVRAAVWGEKNGQNDLKWYSLENLGNGRFGTEADLLTHKETGVFHVHVYGVVNGRETFIDGKDLELTGIDIPEPQLETALNGQVAEITLINASEYPSARAAVWSETNGQDDLVWYTMNKKSDGSFTLNVNLGVHRSTGRFDIHVYSGNTYVAGKSIELETVEAPVLHVETAEGRPGVVTVTLSNASGFTNVRTAIWGSKNYQDDIRWYELKDSGDGSFRAEIDLSSHGEEGYYYFHTYGQNNGADVFIDGFIADPQVPDINEEKVIIDENSALELARRSGDEELNILFIGNSITLHPLADYWWGLWGMAATDVDKDYVHTVTNSFDKYIDTHYELHSFVPWEAEEHDRTSLLPSLDAKLNEKLDLIVIEVGDNMVFASDPQADYEALFQYCNSKAPKAKIVTVGNFLVVPQAEAGKSAACVNSDIPLVDLNDIRNDPKYQCGMGTLVNGDDGSLHPVDGVAVALHPGNYGMDKIGKRVIRAALGN